MSKDLGVLFLIIILLSANVFLIPTTAISTDKKISNGSAIKLISKTSSVDIEALQKQAKVKGWTFSVGENSVTDRSIDELCGFELPEGWWVNASFDDSLELRATGGLPGKFDWRSKGGCTPIKNQGACGSCWAFGTVAPLESQIKIKYGKTVDLSEQFLVSCNHNDWGCQGGYWAHDYHVDPGAVLEADFPYVAQNKPCGGPYDHPYKIEDWKYIGSSSNAPSVEAMKQAIYDYGPISAAVTVKSAFQSYNSGVFNQDASGQPNHAIALVGWDDNKGKNGAWILRNSWGSDWGMNGYMYIEYGCSKVGYSSNYIICGNTPPPPKENIDLNVEILKITNDPNEEDFGPIDVELGQPDPPEWYYRVSVGESQENKNQNGEGSWISQYTWNVQKEHHFYTKETEIIFTIIIKDHDLGVDDIADINAVVGITAFKGVYNVTTGELDKVKSDPFEKVDSGGYYTIKGDSTKNARACFKVSHTTSESRSSKRFPEFFDFYQFLRTRFPQIFRFFVKLQIF